MSGQTRTRLLSVADFAAQVGRAERQIRRYVSRGDIRSCTEEVNGRSVVRIPEDELQRFRGGEMAFSPDEADGGPDTLSDGSGQVFDGPDSLSEPSASALESGPNKFSGGPGGPAEAPREPLDEESPRASAPHSATASPQSGQMSGPSGQIHEHRPQPPAAAPSSEVQYVEATLMQGPPPELFERESGPRAESTRVSGQDASPRSGQGGDMSGPGGHASGQISAADILTRYEAAAVRLGWVEGQLEMTRKMLGDGGHRVEELQTQEQALRRQLEAEAEARRQAETRAAAAQAKMELMQSMMKRSWWDKLFKPL